jgi:hypothetical protein
MIFGKIKKDEKIIKFNLKMQCVNCNKQVPGGMKSGENYFNTDEFNKELEKFQKTYLCGICRDKKRTKN